MSLDFVKGVSVSRAVCLIVVSFTSTSIFGKLKACVEARWIQSTPLPSPQVKSLSRVVVTATLLQKIYSDDTMEPSLLRSRFYCVTAAMEVLI